MNNVLTVNSKKKLSYFNITMAYVQSKFCLVDLGWTAWWHNLNNIQHELEEDDNNNYILALKI